VTATRPSETDHLRLAEVGHLRYNSGMGTERIEVTLLEKLRLDRGLSAEEVCEATGVAEKTLRRYENAEDFRPTFVVLKRLAEFYEVQPSELLADLRRFQRDRDRADAREAA